MRFDEHWMGPPQLALLASLARSVRHLPGASIEVGTWQGLSAIPIARAVAPETLHVVDHWLGDSAPGIDPELVKRDNYGIFLANLKDAAVTNVTVHKMGWREFAEDWEDKPVRFLHIDATHSADEVADNIAAFLPLIVPGAVICGDDYGFPQVSEGVHRQFPEVNVSENKLWWKTAGDSPCYPSGRHGHPLAATRFYMSALAQAREMFVIPAR